MDRLTISTYPFDERGEPEFSSGLFEQDRQNSRKGRRAPDRGSNLIHLPKDSRIVGELPTIIGFAPIHGGFVLIRESGISPASG